MKLTCCAFNKFLNIGKLDQMSLHQAWNSKKMKDLRKLHKEGKFYQNQICLKVFKKKLVVFFDQIKKKIFSYCM